MAQGTRVDRKMEVRKLDDYNALRERVKQKLNERETTQRQLAQESAILML
jgi:hypothetical protein